MKNGKVKQVAAFGKLVGICNDLGASYNPGKASLKPTALTTLLQQAQQSVEAVNSARVALTLAINARKESFAGISILAARVVRAVAASDSSKENVRDARIIKRKLTAQPKPEGEEFPPASQEKGSPEKVTHSSSRLDFEGKADTFANLIQIAQGITAYNPNEADLKVTALKAVLADLLGKSQAVNKAVNALANARITRNKVIAANGGMLETGRAVKEYIRSIYGVRSEPARELGKIRLAA